MDSLQHAIRLLYSGDQVEQQQANAWLNEYAGTQAAWDASLELIIPYSPPEVAFFACNMLLSKIRTEWGRLQVSERATLQDLISAKFRNLLSQPGHNALVMQRLGLVWVTTAHMAGGVPVAEAVAMAMKLCQQHHTIHLGLSLLTNIAENGAIGERAHRANVLEALFASRLEVLLLVQSVVTSVPENPSPESLQLLEGALSMCRGWLHMNLEDVEGLHVSPGHLMQQSPLLYEGLLALLGRADVVSTAAGEKLVELLTELLMPGAVCEEAGVDTGALKVAISSLLHLHEAVNHRGTPALMKAVAGIAAAIAERDVDLVCTEKGQDQAVSLAQLMLTVISKGPRSEEALEYFVMLNTVPTHERLPALQRDVFASLAPHLMQLARYPEGFTNWAEYLDDDEEEFLRFREQCLPDILETVYQLLRAQYLSALQHSLAAATTWQHWEVSLFCLRAVHLEVKLVALGRKAEGGSELAAQTNSLLLQMFNQITETGPHSPAQRFLSNPWVCQSAAKLLGDYASWVGRAASDAQSRGEPATLLENTLRLLVRALGHKESWSMASNAFRSICIRCSEQLKAPSLLTQLMDVSMSMVASLPPDHQVPRLPGCTQEDRQSVVEGLAKVIATLPAEEATEAAKKLAQPLLSRCTSVLQYASTQGLSGTTGTADVLSADILLLGYIVRNLDFHDLVPHGRAHPAMQLLQNCWPVVEDVGKSRKCRRSEIVVDAVCDLLQRSINIAKSAARDLLGPLVSSMLTIFQEHHHPVCLRTLTAVTEQFGQVKSVAGVGHLQQQALQGIVSLMHARLGAMNPEELAREGDLMAALLKLVDSYVVFARELFLSTPPVPFIIELAITAMGFREGEPVKEALTLVTHMVTGMENVPEEPHLRQGLVLVHEAVANQVPRLMHTLVWALCDTCPRPLLRGLSGCVYQVLSSSAYGPAASANLSQLMERQDLPGMSSGLLAPEDCIKFRSLALRHPRLMRGRFDALVMDFGALARGEATRDVLLSYEL